MWVCSNEVRKHGPFYFAYEQREELLLCYPASAAVALLLHPLGTVQERGLLPTRVPTVLARCFQPKYRSESYQPKGRDVIIGSAGCHMEYRCAFSLNSIPSGLFTNLRKALGLWRASTSTQRASPLSLCCMRYSQSNLSNWAHASSASDLDP